MGHNSKFSWDILLRIRNGLGLTLRETSYYFTFFFFLQKRQCIYFYGCVPLLRDFPLTVEKFLCNYHYGDKYPYYWISDTNRDNAKLSLLFILALMRWYQIPFHFCAPEEIWISPLGKFQLFPRLSAVNNDGDFLEDPDVITLGAVVDPTVRISWKLLRRIKVGIKGKGWTPREEPSEFIASAERSRYILFP